MKKMSLKLSNFSGKIEKKSVNFLNLISTLLLIFIFIHLFIINKSADSLEILNTELSKNECTISEIYFENSIHNINSEYKIVKNTTDIYIYFLSIKI